MFVLLFLYIVSSNAEFNCQDLQFIYNNMNCCTQEQKTCLHTFSPTNCSIGQFITGFHLNGSFICEYPQQEQSCDMGKYMSGIRANGSIICTELSLPARTCAAGQALYKITADGSTECRTLHSGTHSCPDGFVMEGVESTGGPICVQDKQGLMSLPPRNCAAGQALYRITADGTTACH